MCICGLRVVAGASEASFLEIPTLTCTCVVATLFWLLLTLFIRKLKQVSRNKKTFFFGMVKQIYGAYSGYFVYVCKYSNLSFNLIESLVFTI